MKKLFSTIVLLAINAWSLEFMMPAKSFDLTEAQNSTKSIVINQATTEMSTNSYTISGYTAKYKCVKVPKILCSTGLNKFFVNVSETVLKTAAPAEEVVAVLATDIRIEDDGNNFYACSAAIGGMKWDTITVSGTDVTYTPLNQNNIAPYFTDSASSINSPSSYMLIEHRQGCQ